MEETRKDRPVTVEVEGGFTGWIAVLCTFWTWYAWVGSLKGLALMLPTLLEQFDTHTWLVGWMIAIMDGVVDLVGKLNIGSGLV